MPRYLFCNAEFSFIEQTTIFVLLFPHGESRRRFTEWYIVHYVDGRRLSRNTSVVIYLISHSADNHLLCVNKHTTHIFVQRACACVSFAGREAQSALYSFLFLILTCHQEVDTGRRREKQPEKKERLLMIIFFRLFSFSWIIRSVDTCTRLFLSVQMFNVKGSAVPESRKDHWIDLAWNWMRLSRPWEFLYPNRWGLARENQNEGWLLKASRDCEHSWPRPTQMTTIISSHWWTQVANKTQQ